MSNTKLIEDETTITEIFIKPDGRVFTFGTSRQVLDLLADLDPCSSRLSQLLAKARRLEDEARQSICTLRRD